MSKIEVVNFDINEVYDVVRKNILGCVVEDRFVPTDGYNCDFKIEDVPSALRYGLLTKRERIKKFEGRDLTEKEEFVFSDPHCVNGADAISLSSLNLDFSKMYRDEEWYNPSTGISANLVISNKVGASQTTTNYFNEFLSFKSILPEFIEAVDCRIFRVKDTKNLVKNSDQERMNMMLGQYEGLRSIAAVILELGLNIPLREVSTWKIDEIKEGKFMTGIKEYQDGFITLDPTKIVDMPKIMVK